LISTELAAFIEAGVSMLVGSRDATLAPDCLRSLGVRVEDDGELTVFLPVATSAVTVRNLLDNGRIALCFSRILDHKTYQLKGRAVAIQIADERSRERVDRYRRAIAQELAAVGLPQHITFRVNHWPCYAVRVRVDSLFDQTPGPEAGGSLGRGERTPALPQSLLAAAPPAPVWRTVGLDSIDPVCFQGVIPSIFATCDLEGEPNITYLSQVSYLDRRHVALSCQFFNKTKRNLLENPRGAAILYHPLTFEAWRLWLRYDRDEVEGPLFETMAARIQVIASHTGMRGIFKLLSADVQEVTAVAPIEGFLLPAEPEAALLAKEPPPGYLTELRGLQVISARIGAALTLEQMLDSTLEALDELFGFHHAMVLVQDADQPRLVMLSSRGYGDRGNGAEVEFGLGVIGMAAEKGRMVRVAGMGASLRYGRAVRGRVAEVGDGARLLPEIELPGLADAQAQLALPLKVGPRLIGVLAVESRDPLCFDEWDETFLQIIANQIAMGIDHLAEDPQTEEDEYYLPPTEAIAIVGSRGHRDSRGAGPPPIRRLTFYRNDDCVFLDGEYLIRNVPGRILWRVLEERMRTGQTEFTNRELRLDESLGLPAYRDNLESRLILLRKRLAVKCPEIQLVPVRRGRFALEVACPLELLER
jgi:adenylate cyclase